MFFKREILLSQKIGFETFGIILLFLFLTNSNLYAQSKTINHGNQQWVQYYSNIHLNNEWSLLVDGGYRWRDGFHEGAQHILRFAFGRQLHNNIQLNAGFANLGFYSEGEINRIEFRPHQELIFKNHFNTFSLSHRYRLEERFFFPVSNGEIDNSYSFNFRFRYLFMFSIPVYTFSQDYGGGKLSLQIVDEILLNAGTRITNTFFDQNRVLIGPSYSIDKDVSISVLWYHQFSSTETVGTFISRNILWVQIKQKFEW